MNYEQFNAQRWGYGMSCTYKGKVREIASVDFEEGLVGLSDREETIQWVRHENCELIN